MSKLAKSAIYGVGSAPWAPTAPTLCQKFARLAIEDAHGASVSEKIRAASAKLAAPIWIKLGWGFPASELQAHGGLQEGDVLYKTTGSGGFGHVGIAVKLNGEWRVAENSSTKIGRVRGALGYRKLSEYGAFQVIGRLPASVTGDVSAVISANVPAIPKPYTLKQSNGAVMAQLPVFDNRSFVPARSWGTWFSLPVIWDARGFIQVGDNVWDNPRVIDGLGHIPFAEAAATMGVSYVVDNERREIRLQPK